MYKIKMSASTLTDDFIRDTIVSLYDISGDNADLKLFLEAFFLSGEMEDFYFAYTICPVVVSELIIELLEKEVSNGENIKRIIDNAVTITECTDTAYMIVLTSGNNYAISTMEKAIFPKVVDNDLLECVVRNKYMKGTKNFVLKRSLVDMYQEGEIASFSYIHQLAPDVVHDVLLHLIEKAKERGESTVFLENEYVSLLPVRNTEATRGIFARSVVK